MSALFGCKHGGDPRGCQQCRAEDAEAELQRLRELVRRAAEWIDDDHALSCQTYAARFDRECDCGHAALMAELRAAGGGK
jgi:hypothetical protein